MAGDRLVRRPGNRFPPQLETAHRPGRRCRLGAPSRGIAGRLYAPYRQGFHGCAATRRTRVALNRGSIMPNLEFAKPAEVGFDAPRLQRAFDLARKWAQTDQVPAAGICVGRRGRAIEPVFVGAAKTDSLFLVASLSKPVTVAAAMILIERGLIALDDRV